MKKLRKLNDADALVSLGDDQFENTRQLERDTKETIAKVKNTSVGFLPQELAMGLTFAQLAKNSKKRGQREVADRQKAAAIQAYEMILRFLPEATLTPRQKRQIEADLAQLQFKLKALGI